MTTIQHYKIINNLSTYETKYIKKINHNIRIHLIKLIYKVNIVVTSEIIEDKLSYSLFDYWNKIIIN